eukprot:5173870-Lingulodinium_polyedra.AAC.1
MAHPGRIPLVGCQASRIPLVGCQASPSAPSTRMRRGARYADMTGPATHPGTPARLIAASTAWSGI